MSSEGRWQNLASPKVHVITVQHPDRGTGVIGVHAHPPSEDEQWQLLAACIRGREKLDETANVEAYLDQYSFDKFAVTERELKTSAKLTKVLHSTLTEDNDTICSLDCWLNEETGIAYCDPAGLVRLRELDHNAVCGHHAVFVFENGREIAAE